MADLDRRIAGVSCREVLGLLPDYIEGELTVDRVTAVNAHLAECDHCEKFGGEYGALVKALRAQLPPPGAGDDEVFRALQRHMAEAWR